MAKRYPTALEQAACIGMPPQVFDGKSAYDIHAGIMVCRSCLVRQPCLEWLRPRRTFYDGIAGGKLWRDGKQIAVTLEVIPNDDDGRIGRNSRRRNGPPDRGQ